ncbi:MAG: hypothetical protein IKO85_08320 [Bacteroidaceae bacterium]|nr:hypothetical protein [Bacteroidaceae bacterium]
MQVHQDSQTSYLNRTHWYVLTHLEPEWLEARLIEQQTAEDGDARMPLRYFIPYLLLNRKKVTKEVLDDYVDPPSDHQVSVRDQVNNEIRNALRRYVFLRATQKEIDRIISEDWNKGRVRLCYYKGIDGGHAVVDDSLMQQFINVCIQQRERFDIRPHVRRLEKGVRVLIRQGVFKDVQAEVFSISHTASGIRLTLSVEFFGGTQDIRLYDKTPDDVEMLADECFAINNEYISQVEQTILTALEHKVSKYEGLDVVRERTADMRRLNLIYTYNSVEISDHLLSTRYNALMLICASLRQDREGRSAYNRIAKQHIRDMEAPSGQHPTVDALTYLHLALFVSTKDPAFRQQAKQLFKQLPSPTPTLHRFIKCICKMK